jgi:carboxypeptidase C (cathepsin A)
MRKIFLSGMAMCIAAGTLAQGGGNRGGGGGGGQFGGAPAATSGISTATPTQDARTAAFNIPFNPDQTVVSEHEVTIKGTKVPYKATAGTMPVWDDDGKVQAGVFFIYYERTDIKDKATRPLVISFNGGPGHAFGMDGTRLYRSAHA